MRSKIIFGILIIAFGVIGCYWFMSKNKDLQPTQGEYFCGMEEMVIDGFRFGGESSRSENYSYEGKYSSEVNSQNKYGMSCHLPVKPGERYKVTVLRHISVKKGGLMVNGKNSFDNLNIQNIRPSKLANAEWEEIELYITIPDFDQSDGIKYIDVFVFNFENQSSYFDNLHIVRISEEISSFKPLMMHLTTSASNMNKLLSFRDEALNVGFLVKKKDSWVDGALSDCTAVKFRLKGDHLDHLMGDKWSFRVKVKGENRWNRLRTISLHTPKARYMLAEWIFHQVLEQEDILTTRYDFLQLKLNSKDLGIYAYEEHFDKHLLEYKNRREGVILKFDEEFLWNTRVTANSNATEAKEENMLERSRISLFSDNKYLKDTLMKRQFESAQNLLEQVRLKKGPISTIFDIDKLAKYFALTDIFRAYHGLIWHNQRFYFNPVTNKLEPIGFDGYADKVFDWLKKPFLAYRYQPAQFGDPYLDLLFEDHEFMELYHNYIFKYSSQEFINQFFAKNYSASMERENFIKTEFPDYTFNSSEFIDNANKIHLLMIPDAKNSVKLFEGGGVINDHNIAIEITGVGYKNKDTILLPEDSIILLNARNYNYKPEVYFLKNNYKYVYYRPLGSNEIYRSKKISHAFPTENMIARQQLLNHTYKGDIFTVNGNNWLLKSGKYTIKNDIVIPSGKNIVIQPGVTMDFIDSSCFISNSSVTILGTFDQPVNIVSTDSSARGFAVIQAPPSKIYYTKFQNFNTLNRDGWNLTGAVTFYETDVDLDHVTIYNSHCEDALNIIRSRFTTDNLVILKTKSDGFDADFCVGKITNSQFINTGNDGMDFSGSKITIENCNVKNAGDKGLSAGEEATITVENLQIDGANIGIASKDFSKVVVDGLKLDNCKIGFAAYQKKPEYGGGKIFAKQYQYNNIQTRIDLDSNSTFIDQNEK